MESAYVKDCKVDYGTPSRYSDYAIDSTVDAILREFESWDGCHMTRFAYAGDDACGPSRPHACLSRCASKLPI